MQRIADFITDVDRSVLDQNAAGRLDSEQTLGHTLNADTVHAVRSDRGNIGVARRIEVQPHWPERQSIGEDRYRLVRRDAQDIKGVVIRDQQIAGGVKRETIGVHQQSAADPHLGRLGCRIEPQDAVIVMVGDIQQAVWTSLHIGSVASAGGV